MPDITTPDLKSSLGIYRLLAPNAAVRVSPLCLGGMNFGEEWKDFMGECTKETADKILDYYYENNGNFIDTANHYQNSDSEKWIGDWMHSRQNRDQLVIATKYTTAIRIPHPHEIRANGMGNGAKSLHTSFAASLRNLRTSYVDILYVHWWDFSTGVEEIMQSLNTLVVSGKVLYLGISNTPAWIVAKANAYARAHGFRQFSVYQGRWSAEHRDVEREIFPMCQDEGMAFVAWGALGGGNFRTEAQFAEMRTTVREGRGREPSEDAVNVSKALEAVSQRKGTTIAAVALAYLLVKAPYVFPIIGCRTLAHLEGNIAALDVELIEEDVKEIDAAKVFEIGYPGSVFGNDLESQWLPGMAGKFEYVKKAGAIQLGTIQTNSKYPLCEFFLKLLFISLAIIPFIMKRQRTSSRGSRGGSTPPQLPSPKRQHLADATASDLNIVQGTPTRQHSPVAFEKPVSDLKGDEVKMGPSRFEKESWYYGIDTRMDTVSHLIARSSTFPFQPFTDETRDEPEGSPMREMKRKGMFTLGIHKIAAMYDSQLRLKVRAILSDVRWKAIDIVRLGYNDDEPNNPPVVLVTVGIDDVDEVSAQDAVENIHNLMIEFGLPDVHAEVKTGQIFDLAWYNQDQHFPLHLLRVPKMGASMGSSSLEKAGSLCLFLKIDGDNYALTCQHVVMFSLAEFRPGNDHDIIVQPAKEDLRKYETHLNNGIEDETLQLEKIKAEEREAKEGGMPIEKAEAKRKASQTQLDEYRDEKSKLPHVRLPLGILSHAPGISVHSDPDMKHKRDWALIKLDNERFQELPPNVLPPVHFTKDDKLAIMKVYNIRPSVNDLNFTDPVTTVLPFQEARTTLKTSQFEDHQGKESFRVVKHGRTSGWTAGSLNEVSSDCQPKIGLITQEYCVVNIPGMNHFSYPGDSGACVLDLDGKIVGMLHGGNGENPSFSAEITYVTPMQWLLKDIKKTLNADKILIGEAGEEFVSVGDGEVMPFS
ncbi:hypothetical protein V493_03048 [Pseudogymnoascus sp. VKM F-4281 (FW-2241)]|nr:hypothetical protein V493_03048 [Pseudogymnoascus sp. VKM F-4281 (FW-2241)]